MRDNVTILTFIINRGLIAGTLPSDLFASVHSFVFSALKKINEDVVMEDWLEKQLPIYYNRNDVVEPVRNKVLILFVICL